MLIQSPHPLCGNPFEKGENFQYYARADSQCVYTRDHSKTHHSIHITKYNIPSSFLEISMHTKSDYVYRYFIFIKNLIKYDPIKGRQPKKSKKICLLNKLHLRQI